MSPISNVIAYNVSVHATNLKNCQNVPQALHYLLNTPIDFATFQKFEIRKMVERYQSYKDFGQKAQKLIQNIDRLARSQSIDNVTEELIDMDLGVISDVEIDDEMEADEEIKKVMGSSDKEDSDKEDSDKEDRPTNKMYTEQCQDSPRHQAERVSLWEKITKLEGNERTPSPNPGQTRKSFETPRFCPIKRQSRLSRGLLRDRNVKINQ